MDWLFDGAIGWLATQIQNVLGWVTSFLTSALFVSPDVTVLPQVRAIAAQLGVRPGDEVVIEFAGDTMMVRRADAEAPRLDAVLAALYPEDDEAADDESQGHRRWFE